MAVYTRIFGRRVSVSDLVFFGCSCCLAVAFLLFIWKIVSGKMVITIAIITVLITIGYFVFTDE